ncbi:ATP-binding protein [Flaviaesturariibacter aridisoli]|uniref:Oxygen sensor histidine kinase NreB n=1 Tax=Flaviaesturariibacter aridisoli TaxID=2545761 RepID=A0A4R4DX54_9BACT|nr:ATP-binding protein [Flaviaesturariibacter aridisoli]TCZ67089.1 PAS domain-containing sensor histidine kinase [Flaviaesturariibacter aridisoli]
MLETQYEKLFHAAPVPLIVTDGRGTIRLANEKADALLDGDSSKLEGLSFCDLIDQSFLKNYFGGKACTSFAEFLELYNVQHDHWIKSKEGITIYADIKAVTFESEAEQLYIWTFDPIGITRKLTYDLNERVKEQLCILNVIELCFREEDLYTTLQRCLQPIREGWQFPDAAGVRMSLRDGAVFATEGFEKTDWCLQADLRTAQDQYGLLEVCYRQQVPAYGGRIFLYEEERLINVLGQIIGTIIAHRQSNKRINEAVVNAQEEERYGLAMELHDNVQQLLTAAALNVDFLQTLPGTPSTQDVTQNLKASLTEATLELRRLSQQLAPSTDPDFPLTDKIHSLTRSMSVNNRLQAKIYVDPGVRLSEKVQLGFYRIIQEQLTNVIKYAQTSGVAITVQCEEESIVLRITDNGAGFDPRATRTGIGFENIRRRTEFLNGTLRIDSAPGQGTRVEVRIPME